MFLTTPSRRGIGDLLSPPDFALAPQPLSAEGWSSSLQNVVNDLAIPSLSVPFASRTPMLSSMSSISVAVIAGAGVLVLLALVGRR